MLLELKLEIKFEVSTFSVRNVVVERLFRDSVHRGDAWLGGRGGCMAGGCVWQGGVCGRGACMAGGVHGKGGMHGRGCAWQGVCMAGGVHGKGGMHGKGACIAGGIHGRRDGNCSGRYASYWNAFL